MRKEKSVLLGVGPRPYLGDGSLIWPQHQEKRIAVSIYFHLKSTLLKFRSGGSRCRGRRSQEQAKEPGPLQGPNRGPNRGLSGSGQGGGRAGGGGSSAPGGGTPPPHHPQRGARHSTGLSEAMAAPGKVVVMQPPTHSPRPPPHPGPAKSALAWPAGAQNSKGSQVFAVWALMAPGGKETSLPVLHCHHCGATGLSRRNHQPAWTKCTPQGTRL